MYSSHAYYTTTYVGRIVNSCPPPPRDGIATYSKHEIIVIFKTAYTRGSLCWRERVGELVTPFARKSIWRDRELVEKSTHYR